ncbi:hypothetical protein AALP_AA3G296000 [Arabis alpina]|uniref:Defensin-like protein n=1 Tax=Arabis alpina TaxID=50452 RepID=A0A087HCJ6_ARAAL|nr:hypothetical protein AALP_AA3G296000 [Arabis alpina]
MASRPTSVLLFSFLLCCVFMLLVPKAESSNDLPLCEVNVRCDGAWCVTGGVGKCVNHPCSIPEDCEKYFRCKGDIPEPTCMEDQCVCINRPNF